MSRSILRGSSEALSGEVLRVLLGTGEPNIRDHATIAAFFEAAQRRHRHVFDRFLEVGMPIDLVNKEGKGIAAYAVKSGDPGWLDYVLSREPDSERRRSLANRKSRHVRNPPMVYAITDIVNSVPMIKKLKSLGANPHIGGHNGMNMLMFSAIYDNIEAARYFLKAGVHPNERSRSGDTAIMLAITNGSTKVFDLLLKAPNLRLGMQNERGETEFVVAVRAADARALQKLIELADRIGKARGIPDLPVRLLGQRDNNGDSAATAAAKLGYYGIVEKISAAGASITLKDRRAILDYWERQERRALFAEPRDGEAYPQRTVERKARLRIGKMLEIMVTGPGGTDRHGNAKQERRRIVA